MSRQISVIVFIAGVITAPLISSFVTSASRCVLAQEEDLFVEEDLVVIEPAPLTADEYLQLVKQKIELLTTDELARETEILRKEMSELQANRKLRELEQQLDLLIDQYPRSAAADRARMMLKAGLRPTPESVPPFDRTPTIFPAGEYPDEFSPRRPEPDRPGLRRNGPNPGEGEIPAELRVEPRDPIKKPFDAKKRT